MRKAFIGVIVLVIFFTYSFILRHHHPETVVAPSSSGNSNKNTITAPSNSSVSSKTYKNGTYTGSVENAFYGNVQIATTIKNGQIESVNFLEYPSDNPNSISINQQAIPFLKQEAVQAQSANIQIVTGATDTSMAFSRSLANALNQATQN